jgi:hypothetical protein
VKLLYDDHSLYVAAVCYDTHGGPDAVVSLKRDFDWLLNECFAVNIDPFQDGLNGFSFAITPEGVMREALISDGENIDPTWDNIWEAAARREPGRWVAEMRIPFSTLRYRGGQQAWRINFIRNNLKRNERDAWVAIPVNFSMSALAFSAPLAFERPLRRPGLHGALIPYAAARATRDIRPQASPTAAEASAGFDAKLSVTPSLNLDLTVNPDFSQVEVDEQVTNLDRFELFFPERRQFFVENSDLFARFGFSRIRPFFSRRIGLARDPDTGLAVPQPILYGARLSGKLDRNWRIGVLDMQTSGGGEAGLPRQHYTVAAFQRQVFSRSNVAGIFVNRSGPDGFTRVAGLDYNIRSADNRWVGKAFYHQAFLPQRGPGQYAHALYLGYRARQGYVFWNHEIIGKGYDINDIGFVQRKGVVRFEPFGGFDYYTGGGPVVRHGFYYYFNFYTDLDLSLLDRTVRIRHETSFRNTARLLFGAEVQRVRLQAPFDPTRTGGEALPDGSVHEFAFLFAEYQSDQRRLVNFFLRGNWGEYFNGTRWNVGASVQARWQPYLAVSATADYNSIALPQPYASANLWLLGIRADAAFSKSVFLTGFLQYNQQASNVNLNLRLQWRFRPVSDLFLVYSDNYFPEQWQAKGRVLALKATWWLSR